MLGGNEGHQKGNAFRKRSFPSKAGSAEKKKRVQLYFGHCYSSAAITFSSFLEHWVTFYQVCNTITWWFDSIVKKGDLRNQLLTLTLTSNFLVLDNNFKFKISLFFYFVTVSYRLELHRCLLLPQNRPLLRPSNRYVFESEQQQGINNLLLEKYYQYCFLKTSR